MSVRFLLSNHANQEVEKERLFVIHDSIDYRLSYSLNISNHISLAESLQTFGSVCGCWAKAQPTEVRVFVVASVWQLGRDPRHQKDLVPTSNSLDTSLHAFDSRALYKRERSGSRHEKRQAQAN